MIHETEFPPINESLSVLWMRWAILFFLVSSIFGLAMRYFFIGEVPFFSYKHLLHAHSHVALLGWGYLLVTGFMVFSILKDAARRKTYYWLLVLNIIATTGMLFSFPIQGYGLYSITFSTLQLLVSYAFAFFFLQDLRKEKGTLAIRLIRLSIYWMLLSSLGLWAIAPVGAILGKLHPLYFMSVQWFLHMQLNGWFTYAVFGAILLYLQDRDKPIQIPKYQEYSLHASLFLTYAVSVSWSTPLPVLFFLNSLGVFLQVLAYFWLIRAVWPELFPKSNKPFDLSDKLILFGVGSLIFKALITALLVVPYVAVMALTIRMFVIGFVHLVMLGSFSLTIAGLAIKKGWLDNGKISGLGWNSLLLAFILSEALLFVQGLMLWLSKGFIPYYHHLIFSASVLFPIALLLIFIGAFHKKGHRTEKNIMPKFSINKQTMKNSMLLMTGVALLLMTSCGGGGESKGTYTSPSAPSTVKEANPKGVGEIKQVDLGEGIDEALASKGKAIVDMKCTACHQLNDKRIVGPGFEGITNRRRPEWIMNMITNVDAMLDEDPVAQAMLEECLVKMPNQNISIGDSRDILEFLRKNDLERTGSKDEAVK